jgi:polyhydroxybutyrate depolymerase
VTPPSCATDAQGDLSCTLSHDGLERTYLLHVPPGATGPLPIVFAYHGLRTNAGMQRWVSRMNDHADQNGYAVVYPEGTGPAIEQSWNAGSCCGPATANDVDDVGFTLAILDALRAPLCIDASRVHATGLSNGGHMSYRLACEQADVFASVASVAGVLAVSSCAPARPVPVLHFHGTSDLIVSYDYGIAAVGAEQTVADWAQRNGCDDTPATSFQSGHATCVAYAGCDGGGAAELCTVDGGGHTWPGGEDVPLLGATTQDIDATARIGAFFAAHPMP